MVEGTGVGICVLALAGEVVCFTGMAGTCTTLGVDDTGAVVGSLAGTIGVKVAALAVVVVWGVFCGIGVVSVVGLEGTGTLVWLKGAGVGFCCLGVEGVCL